MDQAEWTIGIDVSKSWLDVAVLQTNEAFQLGNDEIGWAELIRRLKGRRVRVIGLEPSGGYERRLARALRKAERGCQIVCVSGAVGPILERKGFHDDEDDQARAAG